MAGRVPVIKWLEKLRDPRRRAEILELTRAVLAKPECKQFTDVAVKWVLRQKHSSLVYWITQFRNSFHTSNADSRPHVTLRVRNDQQIAAGTGQTIHVYYDDRGDGSKAYSLFPERNEKTDDKP